MDAEGHSKLPRFELTRQAIQVGRPTAFPLAATNKGVKRPAVWVRNAALVALVSCKLIGRKVQ